MIEFKKVSKIFPDGTKALNDVTVTIEKGEFVAVIGSSGAGKSTFLRCINRIIEKSSGDIWVNNKNVDSFKESQLHILRRKIGFIFQQFNLVNNLTVQQNVLHGRIGYNPFWRNIFSLYKREDIELVKFYINAVGLFDKVYSRIDNLSGGQQQRVAIARVLAQEPDIILADEPVSSLDPKLSETTLELLEEYNSRKDITIIVNLHSLQLAPKYAKRIIAFKTGNLIFDNTSGLLGKEHIRSIYG